MINKKLLALVGASTFIAGSLYLINRDATRSQFYSTAPAQSVSVKKPQFYSTAPVLTYPDGKIEAYRPLKEGEKLDDVLREGPVDSYVPQNSKGNYKCDKLIINPDGTSHYNVKEFNPDGKLIREYTEPSDRTFKRNPQTDKDGWMPAKD